MEMSYQYGFVSTLNKSFLSSFPTTHHFDMFIRKTGPIHPVRAARAIEAFVLKSLVKHWTSVILLKNYCFYLI